MAKQGEQGMKANKPTPDKKPDKPEKPYRQRYTLEEILEGIAKSTGSTRSIAQVLQVQRCTVYEWKERHPEVAKAMLEARRDFVDLAEDSLRAQIQEGNTGATIFALKCLGKDRGWVERTEIDHGIRPPTKPAEEMTDDELASIAASVQRGSSGDAPSSPVRPA